MSIIRVNPESIRLYAAQATEQLGACRTELEALVRAAVEVRYFGPNAVMFKTECGRLAAEYSTRLLHDVVQIADAVRGSTSNIASSLGGAPVSIAVDGAPVAGPPVPPADGAFDVDVSALEALKPLVTSHTSAVSGALGAHLNALSATDWHGAAKASAVETVSRFTAAAQSRAAEAGSQINLFIDRQITGVLAADR